MNNSAENIIIEEMNNIDFECIGTAKPLDEPIRIEDCIQTYTSAQLKQERMSSQYFHKRSKFYETQYKGFGKAKEYAEQQDSNSQNITNGLNKNSKMESSKAIKPIACEPAVAPPKILNDNKTDNSEVNILIQHVNNSSVSQPQLCNEDLNDSCTENISHAITPSMNAMSNTCLFKSKN